MKAMNRIGIVLVCAILSACMSDSGVDGMKSQTSNVSTSGEQATNNAAGTRHVSEGAGDWTDTPANQKPPVLDTTPPAGGEQHCSQSGMTIVGSEQGCYFSIEEYQQGKLQKLSCDSGKVMLNGMNFMQADLVGYKLSCQ